MAVNWLSNRHNSESGWRLNAANTEGKRMASGDTGNVVPGNRLRVRVSCPPLKQKPRSRNDLRGFSCAIAAVLSSNR